MFEYIQESLYQSIKKIIICTIAVTFIVTAGVALILQHKHKSPHPVPGTVFVEVNGHRYANERDETPQEMAKRVLRSEGLPEPKP